MRWKVPGCIFLYSPLVQKDKYTHNTLLMDRRVFCLLTLMSPRGSYHHAAALILLYDDNKDMFNLSFNRIKYLIVNFCI